MREIKISLQTATRWFNGTDNELKQLAIQTYPELVKKQLPKSWEGLGKISGYYINGNCEIIDYSDKVLDTNKNTFATENQAKSALVMAKLSQLIAVYNDGWVADWSDGNQNKYCIICDKSVRIGVYTNLKKFLTFKTRELAKEFLENFIEDIETYFNF
jgi:hypothetical protein